MKYTMNHSKNSIRMYDEEIDEKEYGSLEIKYELNFLIKKFGMIKSDHVDSKGDDIYLYQYDRFSPRHIELKKQIGERGGVDLDRTPGAASFILEVTNGNRRRPMAMPIIMMDSRWFDKKNINIGKFVFGHELGHLVLGHNYKMKNSIPVEQFEIEADNYSFNHSSERYNYNKYVSNCYKMLPSTITNKRSWFLISTLLWVFDKRKRNMFINML